MHIKQNEVAKFERSPLVSIITIFFNEAQFITEAVESVLAQTYDRWELLLVDDGSSDRSAQIAKDYAQTYPDQIRYLTHPNGENRGMSATRNLGLGRAKGDYITFLDADDVWLPQKLDQQVKILQAHPEIALVCGRTEWWYSWTNNPQDLQRDFKPSIHLPFNTVIPSPHILMQFLRDEWTSLHDVMVRREAVLAVGGYENRFRGMYEDQVFHAKLCLRYQTWITEVCGYRYRQHSASCCSMTDQVGWLAKRQAYLEWLEAYLSQQSRLPSMMSNLMPNLIFPGTQVERFVQRELWRYRAPLLFRVRARLQRLREIRRQMLKTRSMAISSQQETLC